MRRERMVTVQTLFEDPEGHLQTVLLSDWGGLDRRITRPRVQKAGLALAGFTKHVYGDRLQVLGLTEIDYLMSLEPERAREVLSGYFAKELCAVVLTRGLEPPDVLLDEARRTGTPVYRTALLSSSFVQAVTRRLETLLAPRASIHGVLVDVLGVGVLLIGRSGVGKSEAALDLVLKGHRLVADDIVEVTVRPPDAIWGEATEFHQHHMEIRGMGILNITHLFGVAACRDNKKIEVVVELTESDQDDVDRLGTEGRVFPILGVDVPLVRIPLRPGRNIASLIEVVARNQLLKLRGHDSARAFQAKVDARTGHTGGTPADRLPSTPSGRIPLSEVE